MKLYLQTKGQCLLYATAMVLEEDPLKLVIEVGHDGEHGYHIQEMQQLMYRRGMFFAPIEPAPIIEHNGHYYPIKADNPRFILLQTEGILVGESHAVAYKGVKVYDPNGHITEVSEFAIKTIWVKCNISLHV